MRRFHRGFVIVPILYIKTGVSALSYRPESVTLSLFDFVIEILYKLIILSCSLLFLADPW